MRIAVASCIVLCTTPVPAHGGTEEVACPGDLDGDGRVGRTDLDRLLDHWGPGRPDDPDDPDMDLDGDERVDAHDVAQLAIRWDPGHRRGAPGRQSVWPLGTTTADQGYWEYLPEDYLDRSDWPLLVFLHGRGENGNGSALDLQRVLVHGPPALIAADAWPVAGSEAGDEFVVLSPQNSSAPNGCHAGEDVASFLAWAMDRYDVDRNRVYLTGLSCGGYGVWNYLGGGDDRPPGRLAAAVVPICGDGRAAWARLGCDLGRTPIWAFHGDRDDVVPLSGSDVPMRALTTCAELPADHARYTVLPGVGHDSWTATYDLRGGHDIYAWLRSHVRDEDTHVAE